MAWAASPAIGAPRNAMLPRVGLSSPEIARSVVVLPAPFAPISVTILPSSTVKLTPLRAWIPP